MVLIKRRYMYASDDDPGEARYSRSRVMDRGCVGLRALFDCGVVRGLGGVGGKRPSDKRCGVDFPRPAGSVSRRVAISLPSLSRLEVERGEEPQRQRLQGGTKVRVPQTQSASDHKNQRLTPKLDSELNLLLNPRLQSACAPANIPC